MNSTCYLLLAKKNVIGTNFWKFYLIRISFTLDEPVFWVKVFRLLRLEQIFFGCSVQSVNTVGRCTTSYLLARPACFLCRVRLNLWNIKHAAYYSPFLGYLCSFKRRTFLGQRIWDYFLMICFMGARRTSISQLSTRTCRPPSPLEMELKYDGSS
jgi:hypothetical protein